jgi:site-specific DNA recombinase
VARHGDVPTDLRAAIYVRISRDSSGDGEGVERQERLCRELADRLGLEVVDDGVFKDNDIGASDKTNKRKVRADYARLLDGARAGRYGHILAYSNSRLTRRMLELEELIVLSNDYGVKIKTVVSGDDDLSTEDGKMTARIKASVDAAESGRNSERSKAAHRGKALNGVHKRSPWRAFGFQDDGLTHHPQEARLIQEAVAKVIDGASIRQIGKGWEELGITSTRGTTYWGHSRVKDALFSWKVAGIRPYRGEPVFDAQGEMVRGEWEPIISVEDRARALLELETHYAKPKRREGKWLLSGLLRCGKCGRPMYGNHGGETRPSNYVCSDGRSAHLGIRADKLEKWITQVVHRYVLDANLYGRATDEPITVEDWPHEARLTVLSQKIDELMAAYSDGTLSSTIAFPQVDRLDQERRELTNERTRYYASITPKARTVIHKETAIRMLFALEELSFSDRQLTLRREVESVTILPGKPGARSQAEFVARVKINWVEPHVDYNGRNAEAAAAELLTHLELPWGDKRDPVPKPKAHTPEYIAEARRLRDRRKELRLERENRRSNRTS